jgi:hypothetical protein
MRAVAMTVDELRLRSKQPAESNCWQDTKSERIRVHSGLDKPVD